MTEIKKLDESRHYGHLFAGQKTFYVQDGIRFSPQTKEPVDAIKEDVKTTTDKSVEEAEVFACEKCGKVCASKIGLLSHSRSHK